MALTTDERIAASLQAIEAAVLVLWNNLERVTDVSYIEDIEALLVRAAESVTS